MKLLFDQNLSRRLSARLSAIFPDSTHVVFEQLDTSDDEVVWKFAKVNGYVVVSKDSDFRQLSFLHGQPPKTIWLRIGNSPTKLAADLLTANAEIIAGFIEDPDSALLVLPSIN